MSVLLKLRRLQSRECGGTCQAVQEQLMLRDWSNFENGLIFGQSSCADPTHMDPLSEVVLDDRNPHSRATLTKDPEQLEWAITSPPSGERDLSMTVARRYASVHHLGL